MPVVVPTCLCPGDSIAVSQAKINNNLVALFYIMSAGEFIGQTVNFGTCLCSPAQILAAINGNIAAFFTWYSENGGGGGGTAVIGATANSTGDSTITPTGTIQIQIITITGSARTSNFILDVAGRTEGDVLELRFLQPATGGIVESVRNATAGGTELYNYTTDGSGSDIFYARVYFDGTAWQRLTNVVPVV